MKIVKKSGGGVLDHYNLGNSKPRKSSQSTTQNRLPYIDVLKGIGIILVVMGHIFHSQIFYAWVYSFHMPLFFFAAGCVYKKKPVVVDLKRRIQTIVVPYLSFGFITFLYWAVLERRFRDSSMTAMESFIGLLRGQYDYLDFNVHLWFLPCFFLTVVFYNVLVNINKKAAYGTAILMSVVFIICPLPQLPWGVDRVFKYIGFFAIGDVLGHNSLAVQKKNLLASLSSLVTDKRLQSTLAVAVLLLGNFALSFVGMTTGTFWFTTAIIGIAGVLIVSMEATPWLLQYLGRITLAVLCIHGPVYRVLCKVVSIPFKTDTETIRSNFILAVLVAAITLIVCCIAYEIISRFLPWMIGKKRGR